jgi:hypothetical protein
MSFKYEKDVVAWASEQARLMRAKRFDLLDIENIAVEIEGVGKSEQRALSNRMSVLLAHLLKWQYQSDSRGKSLARIIKEQRKRVQLAIEETPSLSGNLNDFKWWSGTWADAVSIIVDETGLDTFSDECPWVLDEILDYDWFPFSGEFDGATSNS